MITEQSPEVIIFMKLENLHCSGRAGNLSFEFVDEELEKNSRILFADFVFQSQCVHVCRFSCPWLQTFPKLSRFTWCATKQPWPIGLPLKVSLIYQNKNFSYCLNRDLKPPTQLHKFRATYPCCPTFSQCMCFTNSRSCLKISQLGLNSSSTRK